jgi:hypothetical protein
MSMGGLLAQAFLGGSAEVGKGIGNRIREEAKLKRQQALEGTRTTETMKQQAHASSLKRGENEQRQTMEMEQIGARDESARGRIKLTDEVGRRNYEDVTDENGNIIGQRQTESNKLDKYSTGRDTLTNRQKAFAESLTNRIKAIDDSAEYGAVSPEDMERRDAMEVQLNALFAGSGQFSELMNGRGGEGGSNNPAPGAQPEPSANPDSLRGLLGSAIKVGEQKAEDQGVQQQLTVLEDEADKLLQRINRPSFMRYIGKAGEAGTPPQADQEAIAAAQALVQRFIALDEDPAASGELSDRQRTNLVQLIREFQRAGVPLNLNP